MSQSPGCGSMSRRWLVFLVLLVAGCGYGATDAPYRPPQSEAGFTTDGAVLYARECAWCHGADGAGTRNGPNLDGELDGGAYTHFMVSSGRMPLGSPRVKAVRAPTPFTEEQISALIERVEMFGGDGPTVPDPDPTGGSVSEGLRLFVANCAACHSSAGGGGTLTGGQVAPSLDNPEITPRQIAEAMLVGPGCANRDPACARGSGAMPNFDFTPAQVDDIVAYVGFLQQGGDHGGWSIGRSGPVAEGAVALIVGLGAMLAAGRWIGTRVGED